MGHWFHNNVGCKSCEIITVVYLPLSLNLLLAVPKRQMKTENTKREAMEGKNHSNYLSLKASVMAAKLWLSFAPLCAW